MEAAVVGCSSHIFFTHLTKKYVKFKSLYVACRHNHDQSSLQ